MWMIIEAGYGTMTEIESTWNTHDIFEALKAIKLKAAIAQIFEDERSE